MTAQSMKSPNDIDLCDAYFELLDNSSECPLIYHRWGFISIVGAMLGRQVGLPFGTEGEIYPNQYICLMGSAGTRKSSAIKVCRKILEATGYESFSREKTSKEKFIKDLAIGFDKIHSPMDEDPLEAVDSIVGDIFDSTPKEAYISAGELEDFLGNGDTAFISLLTNLWDNLDKYGHGKMTSKDIYVSKPTINLLGGCTPTTFNTVFPPEVIGQGMLSRLILVHGDGPRKRITLPPPIDQTLKQEIVATLQVIKDNIHGQMKVHPDTLKIWDDIYQTEISLGDSRFDNYLNRRHIHYYKLCMVLSAMELSMEITPEIAVKANSILHYTETNMSKALGEFGRAKNSDQAQIIMQAITEHHNKFKCGIGRMDLYDKVAQHFESMSKDYSQVLGKLIQTGKIVKMNDAANKQGLGPVQQVTITKIPHIDFSMLREFQEQRKKS